MRPPSDTQKEVVVIANPRAGNGRAMALLRAGKRELWGRELVSHLPTTPEALERACAAIDPDRTEAVVVIGGDGTVNRVIQELRRQGKSVPLYPFAGGTANDLALELRTRPDWGSLENALNARREGVIDLITVNDLPFATVAGIGVGARLIAELNAQRDHSRLMKLGLSGFKQEIYSLLSLKTILLDPSIYQEIRVESGEFNQALRSPALFVCNQGRLSGKMRVAHDRENADGRFSVLLIPALGRAKLISALVQLNLGRIPEEFISFTTTRLRVSSRRGDPISVFGDGDILTKSPSLEFAVLRNALRVFHDRRALDRATQTPEARV